MLDPNIENTQPAKVKADFENTQPVASTGAESTQPVQIRTSGEQPAFADVTQPVMTAVDGGTPPPVGPEAVLEMPEKPLKRWPFILGGVVLILLLGVLGGYLGYNAAMKVREQAYNDQLTTLTTEQFMLGMQDQEAGRLDLALKRYEYVISLDPAFPGAQEKMTEVMMAMALSKTPTAAAPIPTATLVPTPDTRAEEEIFNNAKELLIAKDWFAALDVMDALRNKNLSYRAIEVDGMYFTALRFRGLTKINMGNLEGGLYDLALVERFAPLDVDAEGVRTWARMYLTGAAYWGARWEQVVFFFEQIAPYFPGMRDTSGLTAMERLRIAYMRWGDELTLKGQYCDAVKKYDASKQLGGDPVLDPTISAVTDLCNTANQPTENQAPTMTPSPTLGTSTPTLEGPTITPTPETPTSTPETPTATPETPSPTP